MSKRIRKHKTAKQAIRPPSNQGPNSSRSQLYELEERVCKNPESLESLKALASFWLKKAEMEKASPYIIRAHQIDKNDAEVMVMHAAVIYQKGDPDRAIEILRAAIEKNPTSIRARQDLAVMLYRQGKNQQALEEAKAGANLHPDQLIFLKIVAMCHKALFSYEKSLHAYEKVLKRQPNDYASLIDIGNIYLEMGETNQAASFYQKAAAISDSDPTAYSNLITSYHYHPDYSAEEIFQHCLAWEKKISISKTEKPKLDINKDPRKIIRIGLISDGLRKNPVGKMITAALENIPSHQVEIFSYPTNNIVDEITERIKKISRKWYPIPQTHGKKLADIIAADKVDILFDLAGHHSGSRMSAIALKPAPVIIKWVGGLINTTGIPTVDYLLADSIEIPEGKDFLYTEKIIRMPGDYICYEPPEYIPEISSLPAKNNDHITFGCFNNAAKINDQLILEWAKILGEHKNSKLLLKSFQYNSEDLCKKIKQKFEANGIQPERIELEGASPHRELLETYNRVDIALDTWPYSGGLTTCEAMAMGVPVVTLPGPTFAGRHSATHLTNAGMPELVTDNWDSYRKRVQELTSDLDSLSIIRSHLRTVLLQSPVCDSKTFAYHLNNVLRAIWQRYTEGKPPAALSFTDSGQVLFGSEDIPIELQHPPALEEGEDEEFRWEFDSKVIAIDHGAQLLDSTAIKKMLEQGAIELFSFDPASNHLKTPLIRARGVHYYPNTALGNGKTKTLYACQSPTLSGTLEPLQEGHLPPELKQELTPLAEVPINSLALDTVNDLPSIDWLILDSLNNSADLLENGTSALKETLLIHANIAFQPTHKCQPSFAVISLWAERNGFRFYCFCNEEHRTQVPQTVTGKTHYSNELTSASALFIPSYERLKALSTSQRRKLAFIAETVYSLEGLCFEVLEHNSDEEAGRFIQYKTNKKAAQQPSFAPKPSMHIPPESEVAEAPSHQQNLQVTDVVTDTKSISKPELTLPNEVARHLKEVYTNASVILEYGSGGSTVLASELSGKQVFTVENDLSWAANMISYINQAALPSPAVIHTVDIGKTGPWARPLDDTNWRSFHKYPLSVWDREDFVQPDVILIDGRFRVACFVAAVMKISKPTIVLFDDYGDRDFYHDVERLAKPVKMIGRMAHFELKPGDIPVDELTWMIASFTKVTYANHTRP